MTSFDINKIKDGLGNSVSLNWRGLTPDELETLKQITKHDSFRNLVRRPYGLTFGTQGTIGSDITDFGIMVSCEENEVPQELTDTVLHYVNEHNCRMLG